MERAVETKRAFKQMTEGRVVKERHAGTGKKIKESHGKNTESTWIGRQPQRQTERQTDFFTCSRLSLIRNTRVGPSARTFTLKKPDPGLSLHVLIHCSIGMWSSLVMFAGPSTESAPVTRQEIAIIKCYHHNKAS